LPPPENFNEGLIAAIEELSLNRYPDRDAKALRAAIAAHEGTAFDRVFVANGSNEVLQCLLLAYGGSERSALVFEPTYALHAQIARITETSVIREQRDLSFRLSPETVQESIARHEPSITFLCSPNNPTGLSEPLEVIEAALGSGSGLVVVDEAYGQFAARRAREVSDELDVDRLVVVRTFSKTWALAGLRLGFAIAAPDVVEACELVTLPYHLSSLTQAAGLVALRSEEAMVRRVAMLKGERDRVATALESLEVELWPSEANFILFRPRSKQGHEVWSDLVERSVLIRDCSSWARLEGCLRVSIGTREENDRFLSALKEVL
jgi:histidinol-phosphate aminotransferase